VDDKNVKQVNMVAFIMAFYNGDKSKKDLLSNNFNKKRDKQMLPSKSFTKGGWNITMVLMGAQSYVCSS
jgi:hypothetical protein